MRILKAVLALALLVAVVSPVRPQSAGAFWVMNASGNSYIGTNTPDASMTYSQDEIAGARYAYDKSKTSASGGYNRFSINDDFNRCSGGNPSGAACVPDYFTIYADSNRYWWWKSGSDGFMSINNGNIAYPEIVYHAWGSTVDVDNDETFYVSAYVKAWDQDPGSTRAVLFARWEDGTHEVKCDNYPSGLPIGQWTWISCLFATEDSPSDDKWEFGIRVTDKVDVDYIWVDDA